MAKVLGSLARCVVGNRRRARRQRHRCDATIKDMNGHRVFRGRSRDVSRVGIRLSGMPEKMGLSCDQAVCVEFLLPSRDHTEAARRIRAFGHVRRMEEIDAIYVVAVEFDAPLAENI